MLSFKENSVDRLIQEHAVYKKFYSDIVARPQDGSSFNDYWKSKAFDLHERLQNLNDNIPYYDPAWENANAVLFPITVKNVND